MISSIFAYRSCSTKGEIIGDYRITKEIQISLHVHEIQYLESNILNMLK